MRIFFVSLFCICNFIANAQDSTFLPKWSITFKPLGVIDPMMNNFTFGIQHQINKQYTVGLEGGYIKTWYCLPGNMDFDSTDKARKEGYHIAAELKYYIIKGLHVDIRFFYNNFKKTDNEYVWRNARTYQQKFTLKKDIEVTCINIIAGYKPLKFRHRFFLDFYTGIGLKRKVIKISDLPAGAEIKTYGSFLEAGPTEPDTPGIKFRPTVAAGVIMGFKL